jgi:hypothetical protein
MLPRLQKGRHSQFFFPRCKSSTTLVALLSFHFFAQVLHPHLGFSLQHMFYFGIVECDGNSPHLSLCRDHHSPASQAVLRHLTFGSNTIHISDILAKCFGSTRDPHLPRWLTIIYVNPPSVSLTLIDIELYIRRCGRPHLHSSFDLQNCKYELESHGLPRMISLSLL